MVSRQNDDYAKWQIDEMAVDKIIYGQNDK